MRLYIGNCTVQRHLFYYVAPEYGRRGPLEVPVGGQLMLPDDMPQSAVDAIIQHQSRFGFVNVNEVNRATGLVSLCYSDRPITPEIMTRLVEHNAKVLAERGALLRKEAGVAASEKVHEFMQENRPTDRIRGYELSVEEVARDPKDQSPQLNEIVRVVENPSEVNQKPSLRRRAK